MNEKEYQDKLKQRSRSFIVKRSSQMRMSVQSELFKDFGLRFSRVRQSHIILPSTLEEKTCKSPFFDERFLRKRSKEVHTPAFDTQFHRAPAPRDLRYPD